MSKVKLHKRDTDGCIVELMRDRAQAVFEVVEIVNRLPDHVRQSILDAAKCLFEAEHLNRGVVQAYLNGAVEER